MQAEEELIRIDRGKRYGGAEDTLLNVATFGADGAIINMFECAMRLKNMFGQPKHIEDLQNAVQDIRNYAAYIEILALREIPEPEEPMAGGPPRVVEWSSG